MAGDDLPEAVRRLLTAHIDSATELEVLLLLQREAAREWTVERLTSELRITEEQSRAATAKLAEAGLVTSSGEAFRFEPRSEELRRAIADLADAYAARRVKVIEFLYRKPSDRITVFADAFRFRRKD